ncbi:MAG: methyltransferase [Corynebacterium pyruviciproducens]|uniref:DUF7782 domain-containing protein n=1 Tax=Corynebacterium pyruviciproducens TaxID=598660 RepID=UPI00398308A5
MRRCPPGTHNAASISPRRELGLELASHFTELGFTPQGLAEHLGEDVMACIARGEPAPIIEATSSGTPLDQIIRAAILHMPADLSLALGEELTRRGTEAGVIQSVQSPATGTASHVFTCDIRPHTLGDVPRWVYSDPDPSMHVNEISDQHVMGLGAASRLLMQVVPTTPVARVLDLGTGAGTLLLSQVGHARKLWGTDISQRALDFAELTLAGTGASLKQGSWFEPVKGLTFDRIIANPPFVIAPEDGAKTYRQSTFALDGATEFVLRTLPDYLAHGGTAHVLGAWALTAEESWQHHVAGFVPDTGVCCWAIQRDLVDPAAYTAMYLRDEGIDPRSQRGIEMTRSWLEYFRTNEVTRIGLGMIHMQRLDDDTPSEVFTEEILTPLGEGAGDEVAEFFTRAQWLRTNTPDSMLAATYLVRPSVALEKVSLPDTEQTVGWKDHVMRLTRMDGFAYTHEIDADMVSLLSGLSPQGLPLGEVVELFALANGVDSEELTRLFLPLLTALIQHGIVLPADLVSPASFY